MPHDRQTSMFMLYTSGVQAHPMGGRQVRGWTLWSCSLETHLGKLWPWVLGQLHFQRPAICLFRLFIPKGALCYPRQNLPSHWKYLQSCSVLCAPSPDPEPRGQGPWLGSPLHPAVGLAKRLDSTHREMPDHNTGSGHSAAAVTRWDHEEV